MRQRRGLRWFTCRRWRNVVFGSPRRLNLLFYCTARKRVRKMLDICLPIFVRQCRNFPGADSSQASVDNGIGTGPSRFFLGWICTASAITLVVLRSISEITKAAFVCKRPCRSLPLGYSSFRVRFTRLDVHQPFRVDQTRKDCPCILIPSTSP